MYQIFYKYTVAATKYDSGWRAYTSTKYATEAAAVIAFNKIREKSPCQDYAYKIECLTPNTGCAVGDTEEADGKCR